MSEFIAETTASAANRRQILIAVTASCLGWSLDLFDLFILLFVAPVIGKLFFPSTIVTLSLAAVYASFAVTLLMRPVGSALFGSYADRFGRKGAMITAVVGVGISTAAFGALPTIGQIGIAAPIIFLILRLIQGIFVGGVVASTHTIGTETVPARWRGAMSGLVGGGGAGIGALLASLVYLAATYLFPGPAFDVWGWRFMFFSGIFSAILGLVIFGSLEESPLWARMAQTRAQREVPQAARSPLKLLFSGQYRNILFVNLLMSIGGGAGYYLTSGYLPTFLKVVSKINPHYASLILICASLVAIVSALAVGHLSSFWGRKKTFIVMGVLRLLLLPLCFLGMANAHGDLTTISALAMLLTFLGNGGYAPLLIFLNERFPTALRSTGTSLSWNIGFAIGGMMPTFVSLASPTPASLPLVLSIFLLAISVIFLIGGFIIPETYKTEL
ncbi:MAG: MFS transporter [Rhodospirillales bacterium 20-58-10]|nr:MAG: MFS transporter [Rhodospirillales bacterium 20-58-10]